MVDDVAPVTFPQEKPQVRELSDEDLLRQLAAFLSYQAREGELLFVQWADTKDFAPADRTFLEVAYMGATLAQGMAS